MLTCKECGGVLLVIRVETPPDHLLKEEKFIYNRICDVQCGRCRKTFYSQPYDYGKTINGVKKI